MGNFYIYTAFVFNTPHRRGGEAGGHELGEQVIDIHCEVHPLIQARNHTPLQTPVIFLASNKFTFRSIQQSFSNLIRLFFGLPTLVDSLHTHHHYTFT